MPDNYVLTTLPTGCFDNGDGTATHRLSVFISPRLDPGAAMGTLADITFPVADNFTSWVDSWIFTAEILGAFSAATLVRTSTTDPSLWPLLFPESMAVRGFQYETMSSRRLISYPYTRVHDQLRDLYRDLAQASPEQFPNVTDPNGAMAGLISYLGRVPRIARNLEDGVGPSASDEDIAAALGAPNPNGNGAAAAQGRAAVDAYRAYRFYNRHLLDAPKTEADPPPELPEVEFHKTLALLADYPEVMRRLGLVIDFELTIRASVVPDAGEIRVQASPAAGGPSLPATSPYTSFVKNLAAGRFLPAPQAGGDLHDGMLRVDDPNRFRALQMDTDGAILKTVQFAMNMQRLQSANAMKSPQQAVAAVRSAGIALASVERPAPLKARLVGQDQLDTAITSGAQADLASRPVRADDVLRGYRLDVYTDGKWFSLSQRVGFYELGAGGSQQSFEWQDEGYVKSTSATSESDAPDDLYLHEVVAQWDGWSLVAPRPGRTVSFDKDDEDPRKQTLAVREEPNTAHPDLDFAAHMRVAPGTLPRLRFGRPYRVRVRAVDLAGNSIPIDTAFDDSYVTDELTYTRHEPVQSPTLVYRWKITEGEWIENLVIRSDRGVDVGDYVDQMGQAHGYRTTAQRHVAPPKATQVLCETHGAFDALWSGENAAVHQESYLLALKEQGTFLDQEIFVPASGNYVQVNSELHHTPRTPTADRGVWPESRGDELGAGVYVAYPDDQVMLPYLADPMALSMVLYDPARNQVWAKRYPGDWPDQDPFRLVLREGTEVDAEPRVDVDGDTCDVYLPPATIWKVRLSSGLRLEALEHMAYWHDAQGNAEAVEAIRRGTHWMLSPYREITFVHAVQRPLKDPVTDGQPNPNRGAGDTFVQVDGVIELHGRSTSQIDVTAHWDDDVDELTRPAPRRVRGSGPVQTLSPGYDEDVMDLTGRLELNDTKHHEVVFQGVGTTRYREYFPFSVWRDNENITATEQVFDEDGQLDGAIRHVLATERPAPLRIQHLVPTFRWTRSDSGTSVQRIGRGLRVYLERPWFSSGNGELLGVVIARGNQVPDPQWISRWAADPLGSNPAPQNLLKPNHFSNAAEVGENLQGPENNSQVDVAGFEVRYDEAKRRWYADLQLETGSAYFPFLKLVFCRYQPHAIAGKHLSRATQTQFIQVAPDRTASAQLGRGGAQIHVSGPTRDNEAAGGNVGTLNLQNLQAELPSMGANDFVATPQKVPERAAHHLMLARLEYRSGSSDLSWTAVNEGVELEAYETLGSPGDITWKANLPLVDFKGDRDRYRIAVEEWELYPTDAEVKVEEAPDVEPPPEAAQPAYGDQGAFDGNVASQVASPSGGNNLVPSGRLVYVAHLAVPTRDRIDQLQST